MAPSPVTTTGAVTTGDDVSVREDGDSQPLLSQPILDAVTAAEVVLRSSLDEFHEDDRALDAAILGFTDNRARRPDGSAADVAAPLPVTATAPTLDSMLALLQRNALVQQEILLRLNAMDDNNDKNTTQLRAAMSSKADST